MLTRRTWQAVPALLLLAGGAASATKLTSAAVTGAVTLDRTRAAVGEIVTVRLSVTALADIPTLRQHIYALDKCALELAGTDPPLVEKVKQGSVITATARYKVTQAAPCIIAAEVVSHEGKHSRLASIFSETVNPGSPVHDNTTPGKVGDGRPSADFQSR